MDVVALAIILFAAVTLQGWIFCRFAFSRLEYACRFSVEEAHEGDDLYLVETVYNKKPLPIPWLKVDIHSSRWLDFAGTCSVVTQDNRRVTSTFLLKGYQRTTRRWKLKCLKRGIFQTENVTLVSGDLLSVRSVSIPMKVGAGLVVYPEVLPIEEMFIPVNYLQSDHIVRRWMVDDPFIVAGAREYTPGDPMNRVHWPATAREGKLMIRKNEHTSQMSFCILLNMQSRQFEQNDVVDKRLAELGIKVAATLLDRALAEGAPVRLGTNGCTLEDSGRMVFSEELSGREHVKGLLRILAGLTMRTVKDFETYLDDRVQEIYNSEVLLITPYLSRGICEHARALEAAMNSVRVILLHPNYETGLVPGDLDLYVLSPEFAGKILYSGVEET